MYQRWLSAVLVDLHVGQKRRAAQVVGPGALGLDGTATDVELLEP